VEELKEKSQKSQKGFLSNLYDALDLAEESVASDEKLYDKYIYVMNILPYLEPQEYSSKIKRLLLNETCIEEVKNNRVKLLDAKKTIEVLENFFKSEKLSEMDFTFIVKNLGWYYET